MDAKLTIKLNKNVVDRAKEYSTTQNRSLSRIIESYLSSLVSRTNTASDNEIQISPFIKSMSTGVHLPVDIDYKKEYAEYLTEKHK